MPKPLSILIVEDSIDDTMLLVRELKRGGYEPMYERVETAETMQEALERRAWDLVISDYLMPKFSGITALEIMKKTDIDLPFIIVSGNIGEDIAVSAMKAGAHDYIIKGNLSRLVPAVDRELREAQMRRERREASARVLRLNRLYAVLSRVNEVIVRVRDADVLYRQVCRIAVEHELFKMAWIGILDPETRRVNVVASHGNGVEYLDGIVISATDTPDGMGPTGRAIIEERPVISSDIANDPLMLPWRAEALRYGFRSSASIPLLSGKRVVGALTAYSDVTRFFTEEETNLLSSLAGDISFAIETMDNEKKRREAEQRTNVMNSLLALFSRKYDLQEYLDAAIELIRNWSGCRKAGFRIIDRNLNIPFVSCTGYDDRFLASEGTLSLTRDVCICSRIIAGAPEPHELPAMTQHGSFYANDSLKFLAALSPELQSRYRGHCMKMGYRSLAVIPIRYRDKVLGAMHLADTREGMVPTMHVEFLEQLAQVVGEAVFRFGIEDDLRNNYDTLQRTSQLLERIFSTTHMLVAYLDQNMNFIRVNRAYAEAEAHDPDFFVGRNYAEVQHDEGLQRVFRRVAETGEPHYAFEQPFTFAGLNNGEVSFLDWSLLPVREAEGTVNGLVLTLVDVTVRKKTEEERARLASAVESSADAVVITDGHSGIIQYVNRAFEQITGYTKSEALGRTIHILESGKQNEEFYRRLRETLHRDGVWRGQLVNKKKDGTLYYEDCTFSPVLGPSGDIVNYISVKRDVTEKLRLESIAESVNTMENVGFIFSGVRHEIGNPVNSINMILGLLKSKLHSLSPEAIEGYLDRVMGQVDRVDFLLKSLKSFNMYETQDPKVIQLGQFIEHFVPLVKEDLSKKGIALDIALDSRTERVYADPRALQQVLVNLLTNAADAVKEQEQPRVSLAVFKSGGNVHIQVEDNGCGIPEDRMKDLFKPFYTTKEHGTGLGLVIVKKMLTRMNGTIDVESRKDAGTLVTISLPEDKHENL